MIIWRGFGILGVVIIVGFVALFMALLGNHSGPMDNIAGGLGLLTGGAACGALGWWLNLQRPEAKTQEHLTAMRAELWQRVHAGTFQVQPGAAAPTSELEARSQVEQVVASQEQGVRKTLRNNHSLFFIPLQWVGLLAILGGTVSVVWGVVGLIS
ncbi:MULTISPECIES: transcriptional accessory protein [Actinomyces]|uniref:Transcriptional accessory protein n=1 Tax=Actinomyces respiraculi TaxID=2744574 RepID=A0A7T0PWL6_9ACTO|nr:MULTISPECIES: transcriptional accessory protein [Actinomyces]QPL05603.1 transcriptional accessory protein [Actinomyces respiraculi]